MSPSVHRSLEKQPDTPSNHTETEVFAMNIGIYGGTFNPPHLGHFQAARAAIAALKLDKLILIPAALPPH